MSRQEADSLRQAEAKAAKADGKKAKRKAKEATTALWAAHRGHTLRLAENIEALTGLESRLTILGHLQRGGTPSAADRLLATRLGAACANLVAEDVSGVMVAARGEGSEPVPLEDVAGKLKLVPLDHGWVQTARAVGTCLGD